jgi:hypothetical protein
MHNIFEVPSSTPAAVQEGCSLHFAIEVSTSMDATSPPT